MYKVKNVTKISQPFTNDQMEHFEIAPQEEIESKFPPRGSYGDVFKIEKIGEKKQPVKPEGGGE